MNKMSCVEQITVNTVTNYIDGGVYTGGNKS